MRYALRLAELGDGVANSRHFNFSRPWIPVQMAWVNGSVLSAMDPSYPPQIQLDGDPLGVTNQSYYHNHPIGVTDYINLANVAAGGGDVDLTFFHFSPGAYQFKASSNNNVLVLYYLEFIQ